MSNKENQDRIGNYQFIKTIGEGTFGKVKLSIHLPTKEYVAIKILEKSKIQEKEELIRIEREIKYLKMLNHPNIIQIYEVIDNPKGFYIVMEYVSGGELFNYIVDHEKLAEEEASFFFTQLIYGIKEIHKKKICHRDIKPENLLLTEKKVIKIIDFGLSNEYINTLSTKCGSPCYAAPEMIRGMNYNGLMIDIWACGITLFAMLCGYLPFDDKKNTILFRKILQCKVEFPDDNDTHLSNEAKDLLMRILTPHPFKRIKIDEILNHPFLKNGVKEYKKTVKPVIFVQDKIIIDYMINKLKFSNKNELIMRSIKTNKHNKYTTTYKLLKNKIIEGRFDYNYNDKNNSNISVSSVYNHLQINNRDNNKNNDNYIPKRNKPEIKANLRKSIKINVVSNTNNKRNKTCSNDNKRNLEVKDIKNNQYLMDNNLGLLKNNNLFMKDKIKMNPLYQEMISKNNINKFKKYIDTSVSVEKKQINKHKKILSKTPFRFMVNPFNYEQYAYTNKKMIYFPNHITNRRNGLSADKIKQKKIKYIPNPLVTRFSNGIKNLNLKLEKMRNEYVLSPIPKMKYYTKSGLSADKANNNYIRLKSNHIKINNINNYIYIKNGNNDIVNRNREISSELSTNITSTSPNNITNYYNFKTITFNNYNNNITSPRTPLNTKNNITYNKIPYYNNNKKNYTTIQNDTNRKYIINNNRLNTINTDTPCNNFTYIQGKKIIKYKNGNNNIKLINQINNNYVPLSRRSKNPLKSMRNISNQERAKAINHTVENIYYNRNNNNNNNNILNRNHYNNNLLIIQKPKIKNFLITNTNLNIKQIRTKLISFCNKYKCTYNNFKDWKYTIIIDNNNSFILEINSDINNNILKLYHNTGSEIITREKMDKFWFEISIH